MPKKFKPLDLSKIKTYSLSDRSSKVSTADFAKTSQKGASFKDFLNGLPNILAGSDLRSVISATAAAADNNKTIILGMGAHVIKVGLNPVVIDLMERGIITCVAMNGAGIIHDVELAMAGHTSEDVATAIDDGSFGMAEDTGVFLGNALAESRQDSDGLGQAVGRAIQEKKLPFSKQSILAVGFRLGIPVTVHVAIGTDTIHFHPDCDGRALGKATLRDFYLFSSLVLPPLPLLLLPFLHLII